MKARQGNHLRSFDPVQLLERVEKRLSLPKLSDHEFVLDLEPEEDNPEKIIASLRSVSDCDKTDCACRLGNYAEWGIVTGAEIPVSVKFDFGQFNSWVGEYDDTYIEVSAREVPSPCLLGNLPTVDPADLGPRIVPCTTEAT